LSVSFRDRSLIAATHVPSIGLRPGCDQRPP
jgi:hypothetical protein